MFEEIKKLLIETASLPQDVEITEASRLKEDLEFDSLYAVELILTLEEHYDFHAEASEIAELYTVGDVVLLVKKKLAEKKDR